MRHPVLREGWKSKREEIVVDIKVYYTLRHRPWRRRRRQYPKKYLGGLHQSFLTAIFLLGSGENFILDPDVFTGDMFVPIFENSFHCGVVNEI